MTKCIMDHDTNRQNHGRTLDIQLPKYGRITKAERRAHGFKAEHKIHPIAETKKVIISEDNIISDGRVIMKSEGVQNVHFGITNDGYLHFGYLSKAEIADNNYKQLIGGVFWLVRDGQNYLKESINIECQTEEQAGRKLEDGKQLTGKGRLTNKLMNSFQTFYGMAIRNNKGNVNAMRQNVMAILFHYASTAENPMHNFCPEGNTSWCKWQVDKDCGSSTYRPLTNPLSEVVVQILKPVFEKLSDEKLLTGAEKCLTQNQNESLHHVIWSYLPKGEYHSAGEIQLGTALAVGHFNSGMANFNTKLFEKANISVGDNNKRLWTNIDSTRIRHSLYKTSEKGKKRRKQLKAMEAQHQDTLQYDDSYAKDKYYKSSTSDNPSEKGKRQPKCKTCGKPMKGHKKQTCRINQIQ